MTYTAQGVKAVAKGKETKDITQLTLEEVRKKYPDRFKFDESATGFYESQQYYAEWYYGTKAYDRLDEATMSHSSYVVYGLDDLRKQGKDLSKLTVAEVDKMCFNISSAGFKADSIALTAQSIATGISGAKGEKGTGESAEAAKGIGSVIKNGRITIESVKANPTVFSGKSADEVADMLREVGYDITIQDSKKSGSKAKIIKINNTGGERNITQVQVSPGGGRHGDNPYVKISTNDQGIIKVVDGTERNYKSDGKETATIIFTGRN